MNPLVIAAVLLVLRLALKGRKAAPAATSSSSPLLPVLAAAAGIAAVCWWNATHPGPKVIAVPVPQPRVTVTAPPKSAPAHFALPHLTFLGHLSGTDWTVITVVALVLTYAAIRPLLHRSAS